MKCLVTGGNVKGELGRPGGAGARGTAGDASLTPVPFLLPAVLGKAVHSLSRIGDELYLEPLEDGVRGWVGLQPGASFSSRQARCPWAELSAEFVPRLPLSGRQFGPCHLPRPGVTREPLPSLKCLWRVGASGGKGSVLTVV